MRKGDSILNTGVETIYVIDLMEFGNEDYKAAKCMLAQLGFTLLPTENGLYFGTWQGFDPGWTLWWDGFAGDDLNFSFIDSDLAGSFWRCNDQLLDLIVTVWHEVKGHNIDEDTHDNTAEREAFNAKYEHPVKDAAKGNKRSGEIGEPFKCACIECHIGEGGGIL